MTRAALAIVTLASLPSCVTVSSVLARSSSAPVVGACTVFETGHDRPDPEHTPARQSRWVFDGAGRIVEHQYNPEYHSRALVRFRRNSSGILSSVDYRYERAAEDFPCAREGGCYSPAVDVRGRVEFEYERGRLVRRVEVREPRSVTIDTFVYDARGRMTEHRAPTGVERFTYSAGSTATLDRRSWDFSHGRGDELFVYDGARLVSVRRQMCGSICGVRTDRRVHYTSQGWLARVDHPEGSSETWTYDDHGRIVARGDGQRTREWLRYDSEGRVSASGVNEAPMREYRYEGACGDSRAISAINATIAGEASVTGAIEGERRWWPSFP